MRNVAATYTNVAMKPVLKKEKKNIVFPTTKGEGEGKEER